jgi:hypothetical protein
VSSMTTVPRLTGEQRVRLAALADVLIPGGHGLPSASQCDVQGKWVDRAVVARPDLVDVVCRVIELPGDPAGVINRLQEQEAATFEQFALVVSGAYLMSARVRRLLGYPGPAPQQKPALPDEAEVYLEDGILDPVTARGPILRVSTPAPGVVDGA